MTTDTNQTTFTTPRPTDVVAVRTFDAPCALVFAAHTEPRHLQKWLLGPDGWTMPICEVDLRVGGAWRFGWANPENGHAFEMSGVYLEVDAPTRVAYTERFEDNPESMNILELIEVDGRTTMTVTLRYASEEVRDMVLATGMTDGFGTSLDRLAALLPSLA